MDTNTTPPAAVPAPAPAARKPRTPSAPQPLKLAKATPGGFTLIGQQPPETVTDKADLAKWLRELKPALAPGDYRILRDMGPLKIGVVSEPKVTVSIG